MKIFNALHNQIMVFRSVILEQPIHALLIVAIFFMALGSYAIIPFYIFYMTKTLGITSIEVGILLSANVLSQRGLALLAGICIDKFGSRLMMLSGVMLRIVSFILLAMAHSFDALLIATLLSGLGVAMAQTAGKTLLLSDADNVASLLATRTMALNLGVILGPAVGYLLLHLSFPVICYSVAGIFALILVTLYIKLPAHVAITQADAEAAPSSEFYRYLLTPAVLIILTLQASFHFFYTTLELAFPLYAKDYFSASVVGGIFFVNAITAVCLQLPAAALIKRNIPFAGPGLMLMTLSFLVTALSSNSSGTLSVFYFLSAIFIFSLAEVFIMLFVDVLLVKRLPHRLLGKFFGLSSFAAMIGAVLGNNLFGWLLSLIDEKSDYTRFWVSLATGAGIVMVIFFTSDICLRKREKQVET
ncbi:MFS transporter [Pantoea eucalypti]|uniref:MFS transporter n=1 Tax=Pantoea TaxID=53335 RepID=UPI0015F8B3F9|nr:MFS transporter [Pantoea hericii]